MENRSHYVRDGSFAEDASRIRFTVLQRRSSSRLESLLGSGANGIGKVPER